MTYKDISNVIHPLKMGDTVSKNHVILKNIITNPNITVGDYTFYHDLVDPYKFESYNACLFSSSDAREAYYREVLLVSSWSIVYV